LDFKLQNECKTQCNLAQRVSVSYEDFALVLEVADKILLSRDVLPDEGGDIDRVERLGDVSEVKSSPGAVDKSGCLICEAPGDSVRPLLFSTESDPVALEGILIGI
jgi:hypothetical protein